jgi:hypothetical protein
LLQWATHSSCPTTTGKDRAFVRAIMIIVCGVLYWDGEWGGGCKGSGVVHIVMWSCAGIAAVGDTQFLPDYNW